MEGTGKHGDEGRDLAGESTAGGGIEAQDSSSTSSSPRDDADEQGAGDVVPDVDGGDRDAEGRAFNGAVPPQQETLAHPRSTNSRRCRARRKDGQPCQSFATVGHFCAIHSGRVNAAEIGRKGGRGRTVSMLGLSDDVADETLRQKAKRKLEAILDGDDKAAALRAATSLYAYRPQQAPADQLDQDGQPRPVTTLSGREVTSLSDVILLGIERGVLKGREVEDAILAAADDIRQRRGNEAA